MSTGLGILNVGAGDTKLTFDRSKPAERRHAAKIVEDMLRRGFAILIQVGEKDGEPLYQRAKAFDPDTCEYIIVGVPEDEHEETQTTPAPAKKAKGRKGTTRIPAEKTRAVAVARSAGG